MVGNEGCGGIIPTTWCCCAFQFRRLLQSENAQITGLKTCKLGESKEYQKLEGKASYWQPLLLHSFRCRDKSPPSRNTSAQLSKHASKSEEIALSARTRWKMSEGTGFGLSLSFFCFFLSPFLCFKTLCFFFSHSSCTSSWLVLLIGFPGNAGNAFSLFLDKSHAYQDCFRAWISILRIYSFYWVPGHFLISFSKRVNTGFWERCLHGKQTHHVLSLSLTLSWSWGSNGSVANSSEAPACVSADLQLRYMTEVCKVACNCKWSQTYLSLFQLIVLVGIKMLFFLFRAFEDESVQTWKTVNSGRFAQVLRQENLKPHQWCSSARSFPGLPRPPVRNFMLFPEKEVTH